MINTNIYEVTFKDNGVRCYGFAEECRIGDMVVAATSHGPLLGRISNVLDELSDDFDKEKMRYILCRVPEEGEVIAETQQIPITKCLSEIEQKVKSDHLAKIGQMMDEFMEQHKKEVMRLVFADYSEDFKELAKEYDKLNDSLNCPEEEDLPDNDTAIESKEDEYSGQYSDALENSGSTGQCVPINPSIE